MISLRPCLAWWGWGEAWLVTGNSIIVVSQDWKYSNSLMLTSLSLIVLSVNLVRPSLYIYSLCVLSIQYKLLTDKIVTTIVWVCGAMVNATGC